MERGHTHARAHTHKYITPQILFVSQTTKTWRLYFSLNLNISDKFSVSAIQCVGKKDVTRKKTQH